MDNEAKNKSPRRASERFKNSVATQDLVEGLLPFIHSTRAYSFDEIVTGDTINPQRCEVFDEALVYLFYGRPAYRTGHGNNSMLEFDLSVVFVIDPNKLGEIYRVFPFDTGAFIKGVYKEFFDANSELLDFDCAIDTKEIQILVGGF